MGRNLRVSHEAPVCSASHWQRPLTHVPCTEQGIEQLMTNPPPPAKEEEEEEEEEELVAAEPSSKSLNGWSHSAPAQPASQWQRPPP